MPEGEVSGQYKVKSHFTMPQEHYQSSDRKTVTKLTFPAGSRSADKIGSPMQGSTTATFKKPEGDSSIYGVENTSTIGLFVTMLFGIWAALWLPTSGLIK